MPSSLDSSSSLLPRPLSLLPLPPQPASTPVSSPPGSARAAPRSPPWRRRPTSARPTPSLSAAPLATTPPRPTRARLWRPTRSTFPRPSTWRGRSLPKRRQRRSWAARRGARRLCDFLVVFFWRGKAEEGGRESTGKRAAAAGFGWKPPNLLSFNLLDLRLCAARAAVEGCMILAVR